VKYLIAAILISPLAIADFLTEDNGAVCSIPDGYNTAPFSMDFNIRGKAVDSCKFPGVPFVDAVEAALGCTIDIPICVDDELVVSPGIGIRPCYKLIEE